MSQMQEGGRQDVETEREAGGWGKRLRQAFRFVWFGGNGHFLRLQMNIRRHSRLGGVGSSRFREGTPDLAHSNIT
jgi:hypothetical protein